MSSAGQMHQELNRPRNSNGVAANVASSSSSTYRNLPLGSQPDLPGRPPWTTATPNQAGSQPSYLMQPGRRCHIFLNSAVADAVTALSSIRSLFLEPERIGPTPTESAPRRSPPRMQWRAAAVRVSLSTRWVLNRRVRICSDNCAKGLRGTNPGRPMTSPGVLRPNGAGSADMRTHHQLANLLFGSVFAVQTFFRWWSGELAALLPSAVRRLLARGARALVVDVMDSGVVFQASVGGESRTLGYMKAPAEDAAVARQTVSRLLVEEGLDKLPVIVRLPASRTLRKTVVVPVAAEPDLREALPFQIERHTPFTAAEVRYDYRIVGRDRDGQKLQIEMVAAPVSMVDEALATLGDWGLAPTIVDVVEEQGSARLGFNLIMHGDKAGRRRLHLSPRSLRIAAALAMVAAATYVPLAVQRGVLEALRADIEETRTEADRAADLKRQLDNLRESQLFVVARKRGSPSVIRIIDEMARLMPDDTWLTEFRFEGRDVQVAGYSAAASGLIAVIDQSPHFAKPSFRAAVTQDPRTSSESFRMAFELEAPAQ